MICLLCLRVGRPTFKIKRGALYSIRVCGGSLAGLKRCPVTAEIVGSNPIHRANVLAAPCGRLKHFVDGI